MSGTLLSYLHIQVGCGYLSDLHQPRYLKQSIDILNRIPASIYPIHEWNYAVGYLLNKKVNFLTPEDAIKALIK